MVRDLNINKKDELKRELKNQFPTVTDAELNQMNDSFESMVNSISVKTQKDKNEVEKIVADRVEFINSKHLI